MKKMRTMNKRHNIWLYLAIIMTLVIWMNSTFNAEVSSQQSGFLVDLFQKSLRVIHVNIEYSIASQYIRTLAHFMQFFVLSILWGYYFVKHKHWMIWILSIVLFTAIIDESIQLFSDGRAFEVFDIVVDFIGGFFGMIYHLGLRSNKK